METDHSTSTTLFISSAHTREQMESHQDAVHPHNLFDRAIIRPESMGASRAAPRWTITPRVLLVEDDTASRILSSKFLQILGCTTDVAVDGYNKMSLGKYDLALMV